MNVDPQVLQDVIDATFMVPGPEILRGMRVSEFGRQLAITECGGEAAPIDGTAGRFDQSRFPNLDLIRARGFSEQDAVAREDAQLAEIEGRCDDLVPDIDSSKDWSQLAAPWMDVVETVRQDPKLRSLEAPMATCLSNRTGLNAEPENPTKFLGSVNIADVNGATAVQMKGYAEAYADCGRPYFDTLRTLLLRERPRMVERHRELLARYAAEIVQAGYAP